MKKYIKYVVLTIGIGLFIFLMLPFLDLPEGHNGSARYAAQKPQIFTSNPLIDVARKLWSKLSGKPVRYGLLPNDSLTLATPASYEEQPYADATAPEETRYAGPTEANEPETGETPADPDVENARFFLQDDNGEWVLIRQRAPETASTGMHEISIKEDPYDRYVKQERNARFSPAARPAQTEQVPDSKWARLVAPIKNFFGFGGGQAAQTGPLLATAATPRSGRSRGASVPNGKVSSGSKNALPRGISGAANQLINLINPAQIIKDAADLVADSLQDESEREETRRTQRETYEQRIQNTLQEELVRLAGGEEPQDQLPKTLKCVSEKGMIREGTVENCNYDEYQAEEEIKAANRETFRQLTGMELPQAALVPVLGIADPATAQTIAQTIDPKTASPTDLMYAFMLQQSDCQQGGCFWVANAEQALQVLQPSIEAAGVSFAGDPLGKFPQLKADFVTEQMRVYEEQHPQATEEQKKSQREYLETALTPHVLYTPQDITALLTQPQPDTAHAQQAPASAPQTPDGQTADTPPAPVLYLPDAADAKPFAERYGYDKPFVFGRQQHLVFSEDEGTSVASRSDIVTRDLAAYVNLMQDLMAQTQQDAAGKAVQNTFAPISRDIQTQATEELKRFDQTNTLGTNAR